MRLERLDKIAEIIAGQSPPSETYNKEGIGLPFFQGKADYGEMYPKVRYWCSVPTKLSYPNDILISVRAPVGPVNINNVKACIGRGLSAIRPIYENQTFYIYYYLKAIESDIARLGVGSTFTAITQKDLSGIKIPVPEDINDQKRIATILGKAEKLIAQRKETIKLLDEFLKSVFLEMFGDPVRNEKGWDTKTIEQLVKNEKNSIRRGPFGGALKKEIFVQTGYLVYEQYHALNNDFTFERYYIDEDKFQELKSFEVVPGDIIISCSGVYLGKLAIVPENSKKGVINQALLKLSLDENKIDKHFFVFVFSHNSFKNKHFGDSRGSGIPNFPPIDEFKKFRFVFPPLDLQNKFSSIKEKAEILKQQYKASLQELENLYGSLSQRAFKGELDLSKVPIEEEPSNFSGPAHEEDKRYGDPFEGMELPKEGLIGREEIEKLLERGWEEITEPIKESKPPFKIIVKGLPKVKKPKLYDDKIGWQDISTEQLSRWIEERYANYHFSFDMLYRYLSTRIADLPYYSTIDLIKKPGIKEENTFKGFWFKVLSGEIEYLNLKQFFYNAETEQPLLTITPDDYSLIKDKPAKLRSGVYYEVVP